MPESSPHRYPTHILSHSHYHHMCICVEIGTPKPVQFTIIFLYLRISQIWRVYPPSTSLHHRDIDWSTQQRYPTHIPSHKHYQQMCICVGIGTWQTLEFMVLFQNFTTVIRWTCGKMLQSLSYAWIKSMQVPHTYSVPQPLPSSVKLYSICRQTDTDNNYTIYGLYQDFTDLTCLSCVNLLKSQRHGLVKSTQVPHTYSVSEPLPTYVHLCRSRHPKTTPIYEYVAELDHIYALNLRQNDGITQLCRKKLHAGIAHIFCLTTTTVICVFVKE